MGIDAARLTAADVAQRGIEFDVHDIEELEAVRVELRDALAQSEPGSPLRHVRPWLWRESTSGGQPLTPGGAEHGIELRLSRYERPVA